MEAKNNDNTLKKPIDTRTKIRKSILFLERYNYNQGDYNNQEMVKKIKTIIEREVNSNDNK